MNLKNHKWKLVFASVLLALMLSPVYAAPNPSSGTVEAMVKLSNVLDNHTIFSAPQEGSETAGGLVGYWRFNNDSAVGEAYNGTNASVVYDYSGEGNNGVNYNATYNASGGRFGGAFEFDGSDNA